MNLLVVIPIVLTILFLRWRGVSIVAWVFVWWIACFIFLSYGFSVPIPQSVVNLYMVILTLVLLLYVTSDQERFQEFRRPLIRFVTDQKFTIPLVALVLLIPTAVAASVYWNMTAPVPAPFFARTVHPGNPDQISVNDKEFDLVTLQNPYRVLEETDPQRFARHVENGREVYYRNCFYCHGDNPVGDGLFAYGINPRPTNLEENIPILQESFLFWRIAKGGPGLPDEAGPWESVMPAWEKFLTEDEIWEVILFLYDFTETHPREREETISE